MASPIDDNTFQLQQSLARLGVASLDDADLVDGCTLVDDDFTIADDGLDARAIAEVLAEVITDNADAFPHYAIIRGYEEAGCLTRNDGMVLKVGEAQFEITIVRTR